MPKCHPHTLSPEIKQLFPVFLFSYYFFVPITILFNSDTTIVINNKTICSITWANVF